MTKMASFAGAASTIILWLAGYYAPELMAAKAGKFAHLQQDALSYAYHIDATAYAGLLREQAEKDGVTRVEGKIVDVNHAESGACPKCKAVIAGLRMNGR